MSLFSLLMIDRKVTFNLPWFVLFLYCLRALMPLLSYVGLN